MPAVRLKAGHVQPLWAGHPWVYAQAVERVEGGAAGGDEVEVLDPRGNLLGRGFYSPESAIPVRILVRDAKTPLDAGFFRARLERAVALRAELGLPSDETSGYRQVHAEGDLLPGLIVDRLGGVLSVQFATLGMKQREGLVHEALEAVLAPSAIVDRTSAPIAKAEGFESAARPSGSPSGAPSESSSGSILRGGPVDAFAFTERGLRYRIPLDLGQKTGFYFDQRALRARVEQLAHGKRVLDAYSFVGAFAIAAARGGATEVVAVDESARAIEVGAECAAMNAVGERIRFVAGDARRALADAKNAFDLVVVDPPRLAPKRGVRDQALGAYARLAENACRATRPGGLLVLCSCSAAVDLGALTRALAIGATKANAQATVLERWFQGADHPVPAAFGEGLYLKAVIARVDA